MGWLPLACATGLILALVAGTVVALAPREHRRTTLLLMAIGLVASLLKIAVVQLLPQWQDTPPDSITYWLHAKAIALHWSHLAVDAETYRLKGGSGTTWTIDSNLAIPDVLGTRA